MNITLLDGSIGQELVHRHAKKPTDLWSSFVMLENPALVSELHRDYFAAGATVATTNTYPILPDRFARTTIKADMITLLKAAAHSAAEARAANGSGRIAGALGPLGGSYRSDFTHGIAEARKDYADVIATLDPHVDVFVAETVASISQTRNLVDAIAHHSDKPAWIAVTVSDVDGTKFRSGEPLEDAREILAAPHVEAVLINCSRPEVIGTALGVIGTFGKPFGAYANGFTEISDGFLTDMPTVDALTKRHDLGPAEYADYALSWVDQGATIVGGCCEVGPDHIAEIARRLKAAGHTLV